jgi:hypothetical protein
MNPPQLDQRRRRRTLVKVSESVGSIRFERIEEEYTPDNDDHNSTMSWKQVRTVWTYSVSLFAIAQIGRWIARMLGL